MSVTLEQWSQLATILNSIGTVLIALFALLVSVQIRNLTRTTKVADIVFQCNQRYDTLAQLKYEPEKVSTAKAYWGRFWSLQLDQFQLWKAGFIPDEVLAQWIDQRRSEWNRNSSFKELSFRDGWNEVKKDWSHNNEFIGFIEGAMNGTLTAEAIRNFRRQSRQP